MCSCCVQKKQQKKTGAADIKNCRIGGLKAQASVLRKRVLLADTSDDHFKFGNCCRIVSACRQGQWKSIKHWFSFSAEAEEKSYMNFFITYVQT